MKQPGRLWRSPASVPSPTFSVESLGMKTAITICLVPEASRGPFVFHDGLAAGCRAAAEAGFHAVEIFPADAAAFPSAELPGLLQSEGLTVAAVGTGAGWVRQRLSLVDSDASIRSQAISFIASIIDCAGEFGAPAIIGSMQGQVAAGTSHEDAHGWLAEALATLAERAARHGQILLYEPLNRYETNLFNTQTAAARFLRQHGLAGSGIKLLCDLFHMNIEEVNLADTIRGVGGLPDGLIGHIHWADSNRQAMGLGHTDSRAVYEALEATGYDGFLAAEVFPLPTPVEAAQQTIRSIQALADSSSS